MQHDAHSCIFHLLIAKIKAKHPSAARWWKPISILATNKALLMAVSLLHPDFPTRPCVCVCVKCERIAADFHPSSPLTGSSLSSFPKLVTLLHPLPFQPVSGGASGSGGGSRRARWSSPDGRSYRGYDSRLFHSPPGVEAAHPRLSPSLPSDDSSLLPRSSSHPNFGLL